jgi:alkylation response protein AidB-like acyl-CoA dehydrogenase
MARTLDVDRIATLVREVAHGIAAPQAARVDSKGVWPEATLRALQQAGLGGLTVPAQHGGLGQGLGALARACETLGAECASSALCFGMHCVGAAVLGARPTPRQAESYLAAICEGRHLTTLALSEPETGVHFYMPRTSAVPLPDGGYLLNGSKSFVTNGAHCDSYVVSVLDSEADDQAGRFSCVVVDRDLPGLGWGGPWSGIGMRGNESRTLHLREVEVPRDALLGEEGEQIWYVFEVVAPYFLAAMAGTYLGIAQAAFEEARASLSARTYALGASELRGEPVLQHRLGELWAVVERSRRLIYWACEEVERGGASALPAIFSAKAEVAGCAVTVVNEAMTICGGNGYRDGGRLERALRDARAAHVMSPTTDLLRTWTGRTLLEVPLLG